MEPGAGDPDVEQPPLLVERGVVVERLADRQRALLEHRQEDRVPLEALGPVVRGQLDAIGRPPTSPPLSPVARGRRGGRPGPSPGPPPRGRRRSRRACPGRPRARRASPPFGRRPLLVPELLRPQRARISAASASPVAVPRPADQLDRGPDVRPAVEPEPANAIADPGPRQGRLDRRQLGVRPDEDGDLRRWHVPAAMQRPDAGRERRQLRLGRGVAADRRTRPGRARRGEPLRPTGPGDQPVRQLEDLRARPVVLGQRDHPGAVVALGERRQVVRRCAGERVDRLVLVADDADVRPTARSRARAAAPGAGSCPGTRRR